MLVKVTSKDFKKKLVFHIDGKSINKNKIEFDIFINDVFFKKEVVKKDETNEFNIDINELNLNNFKDNINLRIDLKFKDLINEFEKLTNINGNKRGFKLKGINLE